MTLVAKGGRVFGWTMFFVGDPPNRKGKWMLMSRNKHPLLVPFSFLQHVGYSELLK